MSALAFADANSTPETPSDIQDDALLDRTVALSMMASEATAAVVRIGGETRDLDARLSAMAAASESLDQSLEQAASASEGVNSAMQETASRAASGAKAAREAGEAMDQVEQASRVLERRVEALTDASQRISAILSTIEAIASQTNLLALNATIEAARAGEAGRGFAVVAGEVKALAGQTAKATEDISERISSLDTEVREILDGVRSSGESVHRSREAVKLTEEEIREVERSSADASERAAELAEAVSGQARSAAELADGVQAAQRLAGESAGFVDDAINAVSQSGTLIGQQFGSISEREDARYVLSRAKADHFLWKKRLAEQLSGRASLKAEELADHHGCRLGKWYDRVDEPAWRNDRAFIALERPHADFHACAREAVQRCEAGDRDGAIEALDRMNQCSAEVVSCLDDLLARFAG